MSDAVLAEMPSAGMTPVSPAHATEILQLATVMSWRPRLPLQIMHDSMAGRWFIRGEPNKQDYWIRDNDLDALRITPMWKAVLSAVPYGTAATSEAPAKKRKDAKEAFMQIIDDPINDPVEQDRQALAKARLEAEERLKKMDDWE